MICIVGNTITLMIQWYGQTNGVNNVLNVINYVFMAIFTIECVLKLIALKKVYFKEAWNIFDFTVVVTTLVILVIGFFNIGDFAI
jgi:energy-coupling factor transporter transmembrane protein EcfT